MNFADIIKSDKKSGHVGWEEYCEHLERTQEFYKRAARTQSRATIELGSGEPVCILFLGDTHLGARGVRYDLFQTITAEILSTPRLYVALTGDLVEFAVKLRSVAEICAQIIGPDKQVEFLEDWLNAIQHKLILATWCNHAVEREEKQLGVSLIKKMLAQRTVMFDGIGHADIKVGSQVYKFAFSHKFRGYSYLNAAHAGQRYMRFQGIDREIAVMGDIHQPAHNVYYDGPMKRASIVNGTLNTDSLYANRYFSIFTQPDYPCVELYPDEHTFHCFENVGMWKRLYADRTRISPKLLNA